MDDDLLDWYFKLMLVGILVCGIGAGLEQYYRHAEKMEAIKAGLTPEVRE